MAAPTRVPGVGWDAREGRDARRGAAPAGGHRGAARRPRHSDADRRHAGTHRRAGGRRQQQQGRPVHQPARELVPQPHPPGRGGVLPEHRGLRRGSARGGGARKRRCCRWSAAAPARSTSSSGRWRRPGTSTTRPGCRAGGGRAPAAGADEPARDSAGALPRPGRRQHAGRARGDGLHLEPHPGGGAGGGGVPERGRRCPDRRSAAVRDYLERLPALPADSEGEAVGDSATGVGAPAASQASGQS